MMSYVRKYFISGLLVWLPIWVTIMVIRFLVELLDNTLLLLPSSYHPDSIFGMHIPGIGVLITLAVIFTTGAIVANYVGSQLVDYWDAFINKIPLVRTLHTGVKQVLETVFKPGGQSFRKVLLVEYPRKGMWTIAFQTGDSTPEVDKQLNGDQMVSIYVTTTPNPTSGFLLIVPKKDCIELNMSVDQALKYIISIGCVQPLSKIVDKGINNA